MRPLGYMYKRVERRPEGLAAPAVRDIYSLSGCISEQFADYIPFWKHNGFWLFDSPAKEHCLLESLDDAKGILETDRLGPCEPGPYRIIAVYSV